MRFREMMLRKNGIPKGIRTPVAGMKTRSPRPLDDRDASRRQQVYTETLLSQTSFNNFFKKLFRGLFEQVFIDLFKALNHALCTEKFRHQLTPGIT